MNIEIQSVVETVQPLTYCQTIVQQHHHHLYLQFQHYTRLMIQFHQQTEQQAWDVIMIAAQSGARTATVITGASGILKIKFQQWVDDSLLTPYIISCEPLNNGSFYVRFRKNK